VTVGSLQERKKSWLNPKEEFFQILRKSVAGAGGKGAYSVVEVQMQYKIAGGLHQGGEEKGGCVYRLKIACFGGRIEGDQASVNRGCSVRWWVVKAAPQECCSALGGGLVPLLYDYYK